MPTQPSFTIGLEEEYLLVDRESRDVVSEPPGEILRQCRQLEGERFVEPELLRSQIEVNTHVCRRVSEIRPNLLHLRHTIAETSAQFGLAPIAASTHPFAHWQQQHHTPKARYEMLTRNMRSLAKRVMVCGMHVHVGIEDDELRMQLMNQFTPYLPLLLSLSTSSPFWEGQDSGLKSHRLPVFDGFPRTGLPEHYDSFAEYREHVEILQQVGVIEDATVFWWDLRPSDRYPTLEMRITDMCTEIDDALAIAALTQSLMHYLYRLREHHMHSREFHRFLVDQNRWRAIRYGYDEGFVNFSQRRIVSISELLPEIVDMVSADAEALGCLDELQQVLRIPERGTSAHQQLAIYQQGIKESGDARAAMQRVVDYLIETTTRGS
ncbi:MAG: carboxylate-amine ligase [Gammaproteobacteria bacterium]|nr:carboxylate-amine ligase [Gammaproteobacteria bacterium]